MSVATKDLARMAASVAREPMAPAALAGVNGAQHNAGHPVRAWLHGVTTVGSAIAVGVLVFKLSEERDLRRQAEAQVRTAAAARTADFGAEELQAGRAFRAALAARIAPAGSGATQVATLANGGTASAARDRDVQQQLRRQLSDPTLRGALRGQQRSAVLQLYGDLLRSWHLSADKSDRILDLLAEQQLQEMEQSLGASEPHSSVATTASREAAASANNDELNAVLTDQQRKELQRQQDALSERLTVGSLADELSLAQVPLTESQREQLTQVMVEERKAVPVPDVSNVPANSPDVQRALEDWQSALEQRVQDRAAAILTSAQQTRYEQFMIRQRDARNAFTSFEVSLGGDNAAAAAIPGTPVAAVSSQP